MAIRIKTTTKNTSFFLELNFTPNVFISFSKQQCRGKGNGGWGQSIVHCLSCSFLLKLFPAPAWDSTNVRQIFLHCPKVGPLHRLQFFKNCSNRGHSPSGRGCSSVGPLPGHKPCQQTWPAWAPFCPGPQVLPGASLPFKHFMCYHLLLRNTERSLLSITLIYSWAG